MSSFDLSCLRKCRGSDRASLFGGTHSLARLSSLHILYAEVNYRGGCACSVIRSLIVHQPLCLYASLPLCHISQRWLTIQSLDHQCMVIVTLTISPRQTTVRRDAQAHKALSTEKRITPGVAASLWGVRVDPDQQHTSYPVFVSRSGL